MKAVLIINSRAKSVNKRNLADLRAALQEAKIDFIEMIPDHAKDLERYAEAAIQDKFDLVIAVGGDGTVGTVASKLVGTNCVFAVIPLGTYNNFARTIGVPLSIREAVNVIAKGSPKNLDVAEVNGTFFLNGSSIGMYPEIVMRREPLEDNNNSRLISSWIAALRVLIKFPSYKVRVKVAGEEIIAQTSMIFLGNGFYDYHFGRMGKRELPDQQKLSVYILKNMSRWDLFQLSIKALENRLKGDPKFNRYYAAEAEIFLEKDSIHVSKDGEVVKLESPLRYRIRPEALKVILPD